MGVINLIVKFDGKDAQTGLERLGASAAKFGNDLEKSLGGASLVRGLATALAGLNLGELIAAPFEQAMRYSQRMAENSEKAAQAVKESIRMNTSAEGKVINSKGNVSGDQNRINQINAQLNERSSWYNFWGSELGDYEGAPMVKSVSAKAYEKLQGVPIVGGLFDNPGAPNRMFERRAELEKERSELEAKVTVGSGTVTAEQRAINVDRRHAAQEQMRAWDSRNVAMGYNSASQAQRREIARLEAEAEAVGKDPTSSEATKKRAETAVVNARTALIPIQAREEQARIQGLMPQISASSLARVGGGGNVNFLGGREGALETEARLTNHLLRAVVTNTSKGMGMGDVR